MPTFEDVEIKVNVDFEVFCGTCGEGLCYESSTRLSRNRGHAQVEVNVCPQCIKEKDDEIESLKLQIEQLESEIKDLKG